MIEGPSVDERGASCPPTIPIPPSHVPTRAVPVSPNADIIHRYDAATAKHGFLDHALRATAYLPQLWRSRALLWNFARRELLGRFRGSIGGLFWVLVQPIFQFVVYFLVFGILFAPRHELATSGPSTKYALFLFSGILFFNTLTEAIGNALSSVLANGNLVKKVAFPCELLPLSPVLVAHAVYIVGAVVLVLVGLTLGDIHLGLASLCWPLLLLCSLVMATGLGLLLAAADVFARDVGHLYRIFAMAWFFLSPVFWQLELIQDKAVALGAPWITNLLLLNPAFPLLMAARQVIGLEDMGDGSSSLVPLSLGGNLLASALWAVVLFSIGYGFFMSRKHKFADLV